MKNYTSDFLASLDAQPNKVIFVKIISLDYNEQPLEAIEGRATAGSVNIDGASAVRRTCSLTLVTSKVDISNYYWTLKTKFKVQTGVQSELDNDIIWFDQGVFLITSFSTVYGASNYTVNISGKDKMCMLNGELGGLLNSSVCFDSFDQIDANGIVHTVKNPLKCIIRDAVHQYGGEPFHNIVINDLDATGLELQEYRYDSPLYLLRREKQPEYTQATLSPYLIDDNNQKVWLNDLKQYDSLSNFMGSPQDSSLIDVNGIKYNVAKIEYGETAGYKEVDLTYPGDLVANAGESITSILDKIKNMLGDYEYFYDIDGRFVFQRKRTYLNTSWSPIVQNEDDVAYVDHYLAATPYSYNFTDSKLFTSFNNAPNLSNLKNDFTVWGENSNGNPIHMRYAIDTKPTYYKSISVTEEELVAYNEKYGLQTLGQTSKVYWYQEQPENVDEKAVECDWREIIFQMQADYRKYNHLDDFYLKVGQANPHHYPTGKTGYEQYYIDIEGFWRYLYQLEPLYEKVNSPKAEEIQIYYTKQDNGYSQDSIDVETAKGTAGIRYYKKNENKDDDNLSTYEIIQYPYAGVKQVYSHLGYSYNKAKEYNENITYYKLSDTYYPENDENGYGRWNKLVREAPSKLIFWLDFLDTKNSNLAQYSVPAIGIRSKVSNDKDAKAIYYGDTPTIIFDDFSDGFNENNRTGYRYFNIGSQYSEMFSQSAQGKSAKDAIDNLLYNHTYCIESVIIQSVPIYYLQPNTLVYINDIDAGIEGDYMITKLTIPLAYNGTMSITGVKMVPRLY